MDIVKNVKEVGTEAQKSLEKIGVKVADTFDNLVSYLPFSNIAKKENSNYHLEVDLPGVDKNDIEIKVEDGILRVSAVRKYKNELTRDNYYVCESVFGKFERSYVLPDSVNTEKVDAKFDSGVLSIELEKTQKAKPKKISIK